MQQRLESDLVTLRDYQKVIGEILGFDKKSDAVTEMIMRDGALKNESKKVLIFTEYTATAKHLQEYMKKKFPKKNILLITGSVKEEKDRK